MPGPGAFRRLAVLLLLSAAGHALFLFVSLDPRPAGDPGPAALTARLLAGKTGDAVFPIPDLLAAAARPASRVGEPLLSPAAPAASSALVEPDSEKTLSELPGRPLNAQELRALALMKLALLVEWPPGLAGREGRFRWEADGVRLLEGAQFSTENAAQVERYLSAAAARVAERPQGAEAIDFGMVE